MLIKVTSITHNRCNLSIFQRQYRNLQRHRLLQKINRLNHLKLATQEDTVKLGLLDQNQPKKNRIRDHRRQIGRKKTRA